MSQELSRREFVKGSVLGTAGAAMVSGLASAALGDIAPPPAAGRPASGTATLKRTDPPSPPPTPQAGTWTGKIGNLELSRLMLGGNLIAGYAHSRDLRYVGSLMCHYNTPEKIVETLEIAAAHGVDSVNTTAWDDITPLQKYWDKHGKKVKWVVSVRPHPMEDNPYKEIDEVAKLGADAIYLWGGASDGMVKQKSLDPMKRFLERIRATGRPVGVGAHTLGVIVACEKAKLDVDFYQKTLHSRNYATAQQPGDNAEFGAYDNAWCCNSEEVIEVMKKVEKPWIAFKIMAAGAIKPEDAFPYAINGGADFILAGMFDWQIETDVRIAKKTLAEAKRTRPWRA